MGKRKKTNDESMPPLKMVIGLSPEKNKGRDKQQYAVLNQSASKESAKMRSKRKASNIDPKKWKEDSENEDDDLEVLEVYKPPQPKVPKLGHRHNRVPPGVSLIMDCMEEDLSSAQKTALKKAQAARDKALKRIDDIKQQYSNVKIEYKDHYIGPEVVKLIEGPKPPPSARPKSPDLVIVDEPLKVTEKPPANPVPTVNKPIATKPTLQPIQNSRLPAPPPLSLGPGVTAKMQGNNLVLVGPNNQPLQMIPSHLVGGNNSQSIILRASGPDQFQVVNPVMRNPTQSMMMMPNGKLMPPLAPRMTLAPSAVKTPVPQALHQAGTQVINVRKATSLQQETTTSSSLVQNKRSRGRNRKQPHMPLSSPADEEDNVNWVPLDEYYYSKKEGDPAYREQKGEYRFKCWYCYKMLYNNLRFMMHVQGHIDSEKQQNLDLSDLTQCKHCYKQFDTPFEMQCHVEKVHQSRSNVLVCRICEKDHNSQADLKLHMRVHNTCEMPYICQLCNFRSSVYNDVVDHFKKRHDSSKYLLCLYCLKIFETKFAKNAGWGMTQIYYQHLLKHQTKATNKKCPWCKLAFTNKSELQLHKSKDHLPNYRGILGGSSSSTLNTNSEQVMIRVPDSQNQGQTKGKLKSLNAPVTHKLQFLANTRYFGLGKKHKCIECRSIMLSIDHYKKYTECSMCRFATACNEAYANHMSSFHSQSSKVNCARESPMPKSMFCLCGFSSKYGNKMANHLISCSKRTCYSEKPEARWFEYDDEQEEFNPFEPYCEEPETPDAENSSPEKDIPTLFGALGLVKKPPQLPHSRPCSKESSPLRETSPGRVVEGVLDGILSTIFPADAAASEFVDKLMTNVLDEVDAIGQKFRSESQIALLRKSTATASTSSSHSDSRRTSEDDSVISPDLCGEKKWETVKIHHKNSPSKASIFLGTEDTTASEKNGSNLNLDDNSCDSLSKATVSETTSEIDTKVDIDTADTEVNTKGEVHPQSLETSKNSAEQLPMDIDEIDKTSTTSSNVAQNQNCEQNMDVDPTTLTDEQKDSNRESVTTGGMVEECDRAIDQTTDVLDEPEQELPQEVEKLQEEELPQEVEEQPQEVDKQPLEVEEQLQEVEEQLQEVEEQLQEAEEQLQEVEEQPQEAEEQLQEVEEQPQEVEEQLQEVEQPQEVEEQPQEVEEQLQEVEEQPQEVEEQPQEVEEQPQEVEEQPQEVEEQPQEVQEQLQEVEEQPQKVEDPSQGNDADLETVHESGDGANISQDTDDGSKGDTIETNDSVEAARDTASPGVCTDILPGKLCEGSPSSSERTQPEETDAKGSDTGPTKPGTATEPQEVESKVSPKEIPSVVNSKPETSEASEPHPITDQEQTSKSADKTTSLQPVVTKEATKSPSDGGAKRSHDNRRYDNRDGDRAKWSGQHSRGHQHGRRDDQYRHGDRHGYDRNRDHYHDNWHHHQGHRDYNRPNDRYGGQGYNRYDDRHGYHQNQGHHQGNRGGGYYKDRRGGRGGYYGNRGYY